MHRPNALKNLKNNLVEGQVYRRAELAQYSTNIDRHLAQLISEGYLKKLSPGLYTMPKSTVFGEAPPDTESLLKAFLKDDYFVVYSFSQFNSLGLGTTQLYNKRIVFNRKRVGEFTLGGKVYTFHRWREAPKKLTPEFLVIELLNRLDEVFEDRTQIVERLKDKVTNFNKRMLRYAATHYGTLSTQKKLEKIFSESNLGGA